MDNITGRYEAIYTPTSHECEPPTPNGRPGLHGAVIRCRDCGQRWELRELYSDRYYWSRMGPVEWLFFSRLPSLFRRRPVVDFPSPGHVGRESLSPRAAGVSRPTVDKWLEEK